MANFYCEYCGQQFSSVNQLTMHSCVRHPYGPHKGPHKLYEGCEKPRYTCKYCGQTFPTINLMTANTCVRHPNGPHKGKHSPAL